MLSTLLLLIAMLVPQGAWAQETDSRLELLNVGEGITVTFEDNGDYPWIVGNYGDDQIPALVTSNKNRNNSYSETTIKLNSQQNIFLSFDYAVSSESRYDKLTIEVDGNTVVNAISGVESASFPRTLLEANESGHTIKLYYKKDSSGNGNDDCCYLYNFKAEAHEHTFTRFSHKCDVCGTIIDHVHNFDSDYHCDMCDLSEPRFAIFNLEGASATFEDSDDYPWASGTYNETPAIVSTNVNGDLSAISETTVKLNCQQNVVLSLDYAVSSSKNKGSLTISLDGKTIVNDLSGAESGSLEGLYLSASETPHALTLIFKKGFSGINENECGYIYNVKTMAHEHTFTSFTHKCDGCEYVKEHEHQMNSDNHCTLCNFYDPRNQVISVEGVSFAFEDKGNYPWAYTEIDIAQDGIDPLMSTPALKSTNEGKSSTNSELTINLTSQQAFDLSFDYAVSSEQNYDKLIIKVDNIEVGNISGINNSSYSAVLSANIPHTITLIYVKDNAGNKNNDCAYVYNIKAIAHSTHNYTVSSCYWGEDNASATLHLACECGETADVEATVTYEVTMEPTCTEDGSRIVTASASYNDQTFTSFKPVTIPATGHSFESKTLTAFPVENGLYAYVCDNGCGGHGEYNVVKSGEGESTTTIELKANNDGSTTTYTASAPVTVPDGAFSTPVDFTATGYQVTIDRTFTAATPATINLPFDVPASAMSETYYTFGGIEQNSEGKWVATMVPVPTTGTLTANTPYIVLPSGTNISITDNAATVSFKADASANSTTTSGGWTMKAAKTPKTWGTGDLELGKAYGFAAKAEGNINAGQFVKVGVGASIAAGRAYLQYNGEGTPTRAGKLELPSTIEVRFVVGSTTGIGTIDTESGEFTFDGWYDLNGRRVSEPTKGGIYFNKNKKIIVK